MLVDLAVVMLNLEAQIRALLSTPSTLRRRRPVGGVSHHPARPSGKRSTSIDPTRTKPPHFTSGRGGRPFAVASRPQRAGQTMRSSERSHRSRTRQQPCIVERRGPPRSTTRPPRNDQRRSLSDTAGETPDRQWPGGRPSYAGRSRPWSCPCATTRPAGQRKEPGSLRPVQAPQGLRILSARTTRCTPLRFTGTSSCSTAIATAIRVPSDGCALATSMIPASLSGGLPAAAGAGRRFGVTQIACWLPPANLATVEGRRPLATTALDTLPLTSSPTRVLNQ